MDEGFEGDPRLSGVAQVIDAPQGIIALPGEHIGEAPVQLARRLVVGRTAQGRVEPRPPVIVEFYQVHLGIAAADLGQHVPEHLRMRLRRHQRLGGGREELLGQGADHAILSAGRVRAVGARDEQARKPGLKHTGLQEARATTPRSPLDEHGLAATSLGPLEQPTRDL